MMPPMLFFRRRAGFGAGWGYPGCGAPESYPCAGTPCVRAYSGGIYALGTLGFGVVTLVLSCIDCRTHAGVHNHPKPEVAATSQRSIKAAATRPAEGSRPPHVTGLRQPHESTNDHPRQQIQQEGKAALHNLSAGAIPKEVDETDECSNNIDDEERE